MAASLAKLVEAMRAQFAEGTGRSDEAGAEAAKVLALLPNLPTAVKLPSGTGHPVLRHVREMAAIPGLLDGHFTALADRLPWRFGYLPRADAPGLENEMAWAELVGPAAPIKSDKVGFGLTAIGPHTHYLAHMHPAVELYKVVLGTALWTAEGKASERLPGTFILHPSNVVHAMRTGEQALLAIYSWTGDIVSPSIYADA